MSEKKKKTLKERFDSFVEKFLEAMMLTDFDDDEDDLDLLLEEEDSEEEDEEDDYCYNRYENIPTRQ